MLYFRYFDDPHKCIDLVTLRGFSLKYKWGTDVQLSCRVVGEKCSVLHQKEERMRLNASLSHKMTSNRQSSLIQINYGEYL